MNRTLLSALGLRQLPSQRPRHVSRREFVRTASGAIAAGAACASTANGVRRGPGRSASDSRRLACAWRVPHLRPDAGRQPGPDRRRARVHHEFQRCRRPRLCRRDRHADAYLDRRARRAAVHSGAQLVDLNPGIAASGLFWTTRLSSNSVGGVNSGAGNAVYKANNVHIFDFHDFGNALFGAQMEWTATAGDYQYVSAPASTSASEFAELGTERNGSFLPAA
jgi:hypothetical protein